MRKTPRSTAQETPEAQYERLLGEAIELQGELEPLLEEEGESDRDELDYRRSEVDGLLRRRVDLLKRIEQVRTIEDAFPRAKPLSASDRREVDASALLVAFAAGRASADTLRDAGRALGARDHETLSAQEVRAFQETRVRLARESGYQVLSAVDDREFLIKRGRVTFTMDHYAFPSDAGIAGESRISVLVAWTGSGRSERAQVSFHDSYNQVCTDPAVQREIDRVVAIFG